MSLDADLRSGHGGRETLNTWCCRRPIWLRRAPVTPPPLPTAFDDCPSGLGERARIGAALERAGRTGIPAEAALVDALRDGGQPEQRQHEIEIPVGDA